MESTVALHNLILAVFLVLILVLILIVGVLVYSYRKYKVINNRQSWKQIIDNKITQTIVEGYEPISDTDEMSKLLNNDQFRLLFVETIVASTRSFSGSALQDISKLFQELDFRKTTLKTLSKGNRIHLISEGIQDLTEIETQEVLPEIQSFLNNPNPIIYQEAQYAMVRFEGFYGLTFLNTLEHTLSDWQQMRLLESVKSVPTDSRTTIHNWLTSSNESIVIFTMRLIRKFQLLEFYPNIELLKTHPSSKVRMQVVKALQVLENSTTVDLFINLYSEEETAVQKEILKALKISKNKKSNEFLKLIVSEESNTDLQLIAAEVLVELGETEFLQSLKSTSGVSTNLIVKHVLREKVC